MTAENTGVIIPNKDLISSSVTNWSAGTPTIRESVPLGIAYGSDTALFKKIVLETVEAHGLVVERPDAREENLPMLLPKLGARPLSIRHRFSPAQGFVRSLYASGRRSR